MGQLKVHPTLKYILNKKVTWNYDLVQNGHYIYHANSGMSRLPIIKVCIDGFIARTSPAQVTFWSCLASNITFNLIYLYI